MKTPVTHEGLTQYDHLPPAEAVVRAWTETGRAPAWHHKAMTEVEEAMPVLARALHRLAQERRH